MVKWNIDPSCTCMKISRVPLNSSSAFFCTYCQSAWLPALALCAMNGSSNTSDFEKRPAE